MSYHLSKLLAQSRIIPDDKELYDFLKIAKDRTEAVFTLKDKPGHTNQINVIAVKCLVNWIRDDA